MATAVHDITCLRLEDTRFRTGAAAVISGLVAASIAVLVTTTIANSGRPEPAKAPLAVQAPAGAAGAVPMNRPHPIYHAPRAVRPAPSIRDHAARQPVAPAPGWQQASAPAQSSGTYASGLSNWQSVAARNGAPMWALKLLQSMGYH